MSAFRHLKRPPAPPSTHLQIKLRVHGHGGLAEHVVLEEQQEAVEPPLGGAAVEEVAARGEERRDEAHAEGVVRGV